MIWISKAAQRGISILNSWMGWSLSSGISLPQDKKAAIRVVQKAATCKDTVVPKTLWLMLMPMGTMFKKDLVKAKNGMRGFLITSNEAAGETQRPAILGDYV